MFCDARAFYELGGQKRDIRPVPERCTSYSRTMFDFWDAAAARLASRFGLTKSLMVRAHALVRSKLGDEWIKVNCAQRRSSLPHSISDVHPLTLALKGATEECVLDVLRLASYLCAFRDDPRLAEVVTSLRDADKYDPTVFELAVAWSFKNAGAAVTLFPPTPKGVADFAAAVGGREYIVEASGFPSDGLRNGAMSFLSAMNTALNSAAAKLRVPVRLVLEVDLDELDQRDRAAAHAAVKDVVRAFIEGGNQRAARRFEFGDMAVPPYVHYCGQCPARAEMGHALDYSQQKRLGCGIDPKAVLCCALPDSLNQPSPLGLR